MGRYSASGRLRSHAKEEALNELCRTLLSNPMPG
jgi:hypothetical protein